MRTRLGSAVLAGLIIFTAGYAFADPPRRADDDGNPAATSAAAASDSDAQPAATLNAAEPAPAPAAQGPGGTTTQSSNLDPIAATTGTLGLFTVETGQTLPKGGWSFGADLDKFTRMPGSVSVLDLGVSFGYGITNWLNFYADFEPYGHTHVGLPGELSLRTPSNNSVLYPEFGTTIYRRLGPNMLPAYIEDFPFAANDSGGVGDLTLGLKFGLLSEDRGAPVSLSVRNDFIIPTVTSLTDLLSNGIQSGTFNDQIAVAISKNWSNKATLAFNAGYRFVTNPTSGGVTLLQQASQFRTGAGFILFPQSRVQFMNEYTGVIFTGTATPDTTFGARDPVDGVWGVRLYLKKDIAVDAGYRYMLNLTNADDRSGFIVKIGVTHLPEKPVPVNHPPVVSCSSDKTSVLVGSNDTVNVTATGSDPDGDPITYAWTATSGNINGTGPQVRWAFGNSMPGNYTATVRVDDGRGGNATCSVNASVNPRPYLPPTVSLTSDRDSVLVGERVHFTATGNDPEGLPLTYTWRTNGGQLSGTGTTDDLDTTGVTPGPYTVTVRVDDGRGAADASKTIQVNAPPPPPQSSRISGCDFKPQNSARVDNVCKRVLDDVALRLQNDPQAKVVIVGFADPKERRPDTLAGSRGDNAAQYLGSKGIDRSRVSTRTGAGQAGANQANRRIDVIWVPEGATY